MRLKNEIFVLSNALRYYDVDILASLAAGRRLDNEQRNKIKAHLDADAIEVARALQSISLLLSDKMIERMRLVSKTTKRILIINPNTFKPTTKQMEDAQ